ncbi:MAG: aspartyl protease family protein [Bacteroidia bacterium]
MIKKYWHILVLILLCSACSPVKKVLQGGTIQQTPFIEKIPFTFNYRIPFVSVNINGKSYNFMFDTGAATVITPEVAKALNLQSKANDKVTDSQGASQQQQFAVIPSIKVGNISFENVGAVIIESSKAFEFKCMKYDGILGANMMAKAIWQIDYRNNIITASNDLANFDVPNNANIIDFIPTKLQSTPLVPIKIGKKTVYTTFDTGSNGDFNLGINSYKTEIEHYSAIESSGSTTSGIYGGSQSSYTKHVKVPYISLGGITLTNQIIDFNQKTSNLVGNLFFKNYRVILNWNENKIYMIKEAEFDVKKLETFGFAVKYINNKPRVTKIYRNSAAEKAGILINDDLRRLNGIDLTQLTDEQACFYAFNNILNTKEKSIDVVLQRDGKEIKLTLHKTTLIE